MKRPLTLEDIKFQHLLKRIPAAGKQVPVPGFYQILKQILGNYKGEASRYNKHLFEAYYNPSTPDFTQRFRVQIMIWSFYNDCSVGPKEFTLEELVGTVAVLTEFGIHTNLSYDNGTEWTSYKAVWDLIGLADPSLAIDLSAVYDAIDNVRDDSEELLSNEEGFEDELANMLFDADIEIVDEETELVFWEANQPNWCISDLEVEVMLNQANDDDYQANMDK